MNLTFWKYHGLGNDFVVVEGGVVMPPADAVAICDRRRGVGADGVLTVLPPRTPGAVATMHVTNSDGSIAAMCGNGIRCVARHLAERHPDRARGDDLLVDTDAGPKPCRVERAASGEVVAVTVDMGTGRWLGEETFDLGGERVVAARVSMGNPHAVVFIDAGGSPRELARRLGDALSRAVPGGVNAGFAAPSGTKLDLVVWERGAGLTEACGTGACAAALAAVRRGLFPPGPVRVQLPGGPLTITVGDDLTTVAMRGPAELVFEGRLDRVSRR